MEHLGVQLIKCLDGVCQVVHNLLLATQLRQLEASLVVVVAQSRVATTLHKQPHDTIQGNTPLHVACAEGALEVVQALLDSGADFDAENNDKEGPVHWACSGGHRQILATLLDRGAKPDGVNKFSEQPIHFVVQKGKHCMN